MKAIAAFAFCAFCTQGFSQNIGINVNGAAPHQSALLDVDDSAAPLYRRGVLIPRMTTVERNSIVSPAFSLMIFNTDDSCYQFFKGIGWSECLVEENSCPPGMVDMGTYSIEFNERQQIGWFEAIDTCYAHGMRLCDVDQWYLACKANNAGTITLGGMDNEWEWVRENADALNNKLVHGYLFCANANGISYWSTYQFRCCCDH